MQFRKQFTRECIKYTGSNSKVRFAKGKSYKWFHLTVSIYLHMLLHYAHKMQAHGDFKCCPRFGRLVKDFYNDNIHFNVAYGREKMFVEYRTFKKKSTKRNLNIDYRCAIQYFQIGNADLSIICNSGNCCFMQTDRVWPVG